MDDTTYQELSKRIDPYLFSDMDTEEKRAEAWRNIRRILAEYGLTDDDWIMAIEARLPSALASECHCITLDIPGHDQHCPLCSSHSDEHIPY